MPENVGKTNVHCTSVRTSFGNVSTPLYRCNRIALSQLRRKIGAFGGRSHCGHQQPQSCGQSATLCSSIRVMKLTEGKGLRLAELRT